MVYYSFYMIPHVVADNMTKINRVYIQPSNCKPAEGVLEAIREADSIIIGPGSLYTNIIPNLLVNGVAKAIKESKAIKIYINNIMTEFGQTDNYSVADHIKAIIDHCGDGLIDYCIYDTGEVIPEYIKKYNKEGADLVEQNLNNPKIKKIKFIKKNISTIIDGNNYIYENKTKGGKELKFVRIRKINAQILIANK